MRGTMKWVVLVSAFFTLLSCGGSGGRFSDGDRYVLPPGWDVPDLFSLGSRAGNPATLEAWFYFAWGSDYCTSRNMVNAGVPDGLVLDPDGANGPLEPRDVDTSGAILLEGLLPTLECSAELTAAGTYRAQAWIYAGEKVGYAEASVTVGSSPPSGQAGEGTGQPPQDYGDTSGVREVIITLNYMLGERRGELPEEPPDMDELERQFVELPTIQALLARGYVLLENWGEVYSGLFRLPPGVTYEEAARELPQEFSDILQVSPEFS